MPDSSAAGGAAGGRRGPRSGARRPARRSWAVTVSMMHLYMYGTETCGRGAAKARLGRRRKLPCDARGAGGRRAAPKPAVRVRGHRSLPWLRLGAVPPPKICPRFLSTKLQRPLLRPLLRLEATAPRGLRSARLPVSVAATHTRGAARRERCTSSCLMGRIGALSANGFQSRSRCSIRCDL